MYITTFEELKSHIATLEITPSEEMMLLVGEKSAEEVQELIHFLNERNIRFFGGIYSRLLYNGRSYSEGFLLQIHEPVYSSIVLPNLMRFKLDISDYKDATAIVLVDGLSDKMKILTDTIYDKLGDNVTYIGGGAGYYNLSHNPCIFNNRGLHMDAMHLCIVKSSLKVAVKHGWNKLEGPYTITKSDGNKLSSLDNYSAYDIYRDVIEDHEEITLNRADFFLFAKDHPFGIVPVGQTDLIVRDPISLDEDNNIICVADLPRDSQLYILKGNINTLLSSSLEIAEYCSSRVQGKYTPLLFDCISRAMFLDERFEEELANIQSKLDYAFEGALSIGEIASQPNGKLVIHNKSTILGLLSTEQ